MARQSAAQVAKAMVKDPHLAVQIERAYLVGVPERTAKTREKKLKEELAKLGWESHFFHYEDESFGDFRYLVRGKILAQFYDEDSEEEARRKLDAIDVAESNFYMALDTALDYESLTEAIEMVWDNVNDTYNERGHTDQLAGDVYADLIEVHGIDLDDKTTREYTDKRTNPRKLKNRLMR